MDSNIAARRRYAGDRAHKTPPHIPLRVFREYLHLTLDDIADRVESGTGDRPSRGALSAIETGRRGASAELLNALTEAYELPQGAITTEYQPRATTSVVA